MLGSPIITTKGMNLLAKIAASNIALTLSNIGLGDGIQEQKESVTSLVNEIIKEQIEACEYNETEGQYYIRRTFTNENLATGFYIREVGIYAIDPDEGEILYAYSNAGETDVDFFAPGIGKVIVKEIIEMATKFGNASDITVQIDPSVALVTKSEFEPVIDEIFPDSEIVTINHKLKCYPQVRIIKGENGLGVGGLGITPIGGTESYSVECKTCFLDRNNIKIYVPKKYFLKNPRLQKVSEIQYILTFSNSVMSLLIDLIKI